MSRPRLAWVAVLAAAAVLALTGCPKDSAEGSDPACQRAASAVVGDPNDPQKQADYEREC